MHSAWGFFTHKLCPLLYLDHVTCAYLESTFTNIHVSTKHLKINLTYLDHNISSTNKMTQVGGLPLEKKCSSPLHVLHFSLFVVEFQEDVHVHPLEKQSKKQLKHYSLIAFAKYWNRKYVNSLH